MTAMMKMRRRALLSCYVMEGTIHCFTIDVYYQLIAGANHKNIFACN